MKELKNNIEVLDEVLLLSRKGYDIGIVYSEDVFASDICYCFTEKGVYIKSGEDFEKNVLLDKGFYFKDGCIYAKKDIIHVYKKIFSDEDCGTIGTVKIGTYGARKEKLFVKAEFFEDEKNKVIGKNLYVLLM